MDKKFEVELTKVEKLLDKVDNDLLRQGLRSDFTIFFKNMDKTFEIYNVCMEELCGQLYLMDLAFHSRVVRKLFHNYKHQLHNIMKYQLTLQKELNIKYQQEKNWKAQQLAHQKAEELRKAKEEAIKKEAEERAKNELDFDDEDALRAHAEKMQYELDHAKKHMENFNAQMDLEAIKNMSSYLGRTTKENAKRGDQDLRLDMAVIMAAFDQLKNKVIEIEAGGYRKGNLDDQLEKYVQTEGNFVEADQLAEYTEKYEDLKGAFEKLRGDHDALMGENNEVQKQMKIVEEEAYSHQEAIEQAQSELNSEKRKCRQLEENFTQLQNEFKAKAQDFSSNEEVMNNMKEEISAHETSLKEAQEAIEKNNATIDELMAKLADLQKNGIASGADKEKEMEQMRLEAENAQKKVEELLKGGDYADEQLRIHIEEMEDAVEVLKTGKQKWKNNYKEIKDEYDKLKSDHDDLNYNHEQLNEKVLEQGNQLDKLKAFVKEATEQNSDSEDEANITGFGKSKDISIQSGKKRSESRGVTDQDGLTDGVSGSQLGKKKKKIKMSREMSHLLDNMDNKSGRSNKITFARGIQSDDLDPLTYLLDRANDMINMNIKYENVKAAMDVLSTLLGYNGIDELILSKSGQTPMYATSEGEPDKLEDGINMARSKSKQPKKQFKEAPRESDMREKKPQQPKQKSKPRKVQNKQQEPSEEDDYDPYGTQTRTGFKATGINKRFGGKSISPNNRRKVQPQYQEDFSDLAVSKKIHFNPKINREKLEEAEFLKNLSSDDELNKTMSREKMEKEIALFRMYLNLKKRYNKDPKRFLRIFRIYFAKDTPASANIDLNVENPQFMLNYDDFRDYYTQLIKLHERCGDECVHLKRFYNKMGVHKRYQGKKYLVLNKTNITKLPASKPRRKNSLERLVRRYYRFY